MKYLLLISLLFSINLFASEALETDSFKEIETKVLSLGKKHGAKNVLIVLDVDNTILQMSQNIGSDQWFGWQSKECIGKKNPPSFCVSSKFGKLLDIQSKLFSLSRTKPTEKIVAKVIKNLQKKGYKMILLTSRGYNYRDATERELKRNGMHFIKSAIGPKKGYAGTYIPYVMKDLKSSGISKSQAAVSKLKKARKVSFTNGIFMTAGLHKGIMLKTLLHKTGQKFKAIVFADDHIRHTKGMQAILGKKKGIDLITYRYGRIDSQVKKFHAGNKEQAIKSYNALKKLLETSFK